MSENRKKVPEIDRLLSGIAKDLRLGDKKPVDATAWFLGPKAENKAAFMEMVAMAAESQCEVREKFQPDDPPILCHDSADEKDIETHRESINEIKHQLSLMLNKL